MIHGKVSIESIRAPKEEGRPSVSDPGSGGVHSPKKPGGFLGGVHHLCRLQVQRKLQRPAGCDRTHKRNRLPPTTQNDGLFLFKGGSCVGSRYKPTLLRRFTAVSRTLLLESVCFQCKNWMWQVLVLPHSLSSSNKRKYYAQVETRPHQRPHELKRAFPLSKDFWLMDSLGHLSSFILT